MAKNRSSILIAIGVGVFVVGASLAYLAVRNSDDSTPRVQASATTVPPKAGDVVVAGATAPSFAIPTGKQAVAIQVSYIQGVAGYVKAGDRVNVYGTLKPGGPAVKGLATPAVKLVLSNVDVLAVSAPGVDAVGPTTFVLALNPVDAEQVMYFQSFEGIYMSLARSDQGAVSTPGRAAGAPF